ncbi:MAG TPA: YiaA/YiaB family inner membrane protein [Jiangellaceae bacterium]
MTTFTSPRTTTAFYIQAIISFGIALSAVVIAIYQLRAEPWIQAFLTMGILYLVTSTFTLSKVIRDRQDEDSVVKRVDQARVDKLLSEHDPFNTPG